MGRWQLAGLGAIILACVVAVWLVAQNWAGAGQTEVRPVPVGHQEIAWIAPATGGDTWERLMVALELLQTDQTQLRVDLERAFLPLTADVPEVALYFEAAPESKLWIRWYKLSGENPSPRWFEKLMRRGVPPLAVIGGETSDRALFQSRALQAVRGQWPGAAPIYVITTATADRYRDDQTGEVAYGAWPRLMDVYANRTFRFGFTNTRIVEAVLDFVGQNPQVCARRLMDYRASTALLGQGNAAGSLGVLCAAGLFQPYYLSALFWADDSYSKDLGENFLQVFADQATAGGKPFADFYNNYIQYSVGDFLEPNPREAQAVGLFLANNPHFREQPQLLALPTAAQRARRFLRTLCRRAPLEVRNVVVVTGDGIAFNNIYRDRDITWNVQDMPVPLVFFSHRNPIDAIAGFERKRDDGLVSNAGTEDVLLHRDIVQALMLAAFDRGRLVADADQLLERLRHSRWYKGDVVNDLVEKDNLKAVPLFDSAGNRQPGTGEHVIWLKPLYDGDRNLPEAFITVWRAAGERPDRAWRAVGHPLHVFYDRPSQEENSVHGP